MKRSKEERAAILLHLWFIVNQLHFLLELSEYLINVIAYQIIDSYCPAPSYHNDIVFVVIQS